MEMFSPDEDDVVSITDEERGTDTGGTQDSEIPFRNLSVEDKLWACYWHACIL